MPLPNMTPQQLLDAAHKVFEHWPTGDVELIKNRVGNLAVVDSENFQVGWIDLRYGEVTCYDCDATENDAEAEPPSA